MSDGLESIAGTEERTVRRRLLRTIVSNVIVAAGIGWVIYILWRGIPDFQNEFRIDSWSWLGYTLCAGSVAQLLLVPVFRSFLNRGGGADIDYSYAARLVFVGQMLRHLPGRLWGIVYLVQETKQTIPPAAMIRANLDVMFYSMICSLLVAGMLTLGVTVGWLVAAILVICCLAILVFSISNDWTGSVLRRLIRLAPAKAEKYADALRMKESMSRMAALLIVGYFSVAWCLYISIWWTLPQIFPGLEGVNIWLLCASYSAAWVVGYVAMITPGGLGVREAGFIAMSAKLTTLANLAFVAVFVRLWQISIELMLFFAFAFVKRKSRSAQVITTDKVDPKL